MFDQRISRVMMNSQSNSYSGKKMALSKQSQLILSLAFMADTTQTMDTYFKSQMESGGKNDDGRNDGDQVHQNFP